MSRITVQQCHDLIEAEYPLALYFGFRVEALEDGFARARLPYSPKILRLGGTIGGPALMALADFCMYLAVLTRYDWETGIHSVTTNMTTAFLRPPGKYDVIAEARIRKAGRRLCFLEVELVSDGQKEGSVAHVTGTYAMPASQR